MKANRSYPLEFENNPEIFPAAGWKTAFRLGWDFLLVGLAAIGMLLAISPWGAQAAGVLSPVRIVLGFAYMLFLPGYAFQAAVFPRAGDLSGIQRAGWSVVFSIALVPLTTLVISLFSGGIRLWPVAISQTVVICAFSVAALARRMQLSTEEAFIPHLKLPFRSWLQSQDRVNKLLLALLSLAVVGGLVSAFLVTTLPQPASHYTEFYLLDAKGRAENFPLQAIPRQRLSFTAVIHNQEVGAGSYQIEMRDGEQTIARSQSVRLKDGESIRVPFSFTPVHTADPVPISFYLYRNNEPQPYRTLTLWVSIKPLP